MKLDLKAEIKNITHFFELNFQKKPHVSSWDLYIAFAWLMYFSQE